MRNASTPPTALSKTIWKKNIRFDASMSSAHAPAVTNIGLSNSAKGRMLHSHAHQLPLDRERATHDADCLCILHKVNFSVFVNYSLDHRSQSLALIYSLPCSLHLSLSLSWSVWHGRLHFPTKLTTAAFARTHAYLSPCVYLWTMDMHRQEGEMRI